MGCPTQVELGDNVVFSITTHDPDTGVLTDADSAPSYRIYEDETATPILTGNLAKLDDVNTTGFYSKLIACTTANGFEVGKSYNIYIEATVDSDTGGISFAFNITDERSDVDRLVTALVNKAIWTEATGSLEMFSDAGVSHGSIAAQISSDGTYTTRKRSYEEDCV